jgi:hypothetical protein
MTNFVNIKYNKKNLKEANFVSINSHSEIFTKINSQELIDFIEQKLNSQITNSIMGEKRKSLKEQFCGYVSKDEIPLISNEVVDYCPLDLPIGESLSFIQDGWIAGGAIAAIINEFLFNKKAVINDVDYFFYNNNPELSNSEVYKNKYEHLNELDNGYLIKSSTKLDIEGHVVNLIKIDTSCSFKWEHLLQSFDLNCTAVAYHPILKQIIILPEYLDFLISGQIKPITTGDRFVKKLGKYSFFFYNTFSTIIRAKRKAEELDKLFFYHDFIKTLMINNQDFLYHIISKKELRFVSNFKNWKKLKINSNFTFFIAKKDLCFLKNNLSVFEPFFKLDYEKGRLIPNTNINLFNFLSDKTDRDIFNLMIFILRKEFKNFPNEDVGEPVYRRLSEVVKIYNQVEQANNTPLTYTSPLSKVFDLFMPSLIKKDYKQNVIKNLIVLFKQHQELHSLFSLHKNQIKKDNLIAFLILLRNQPIELIGLIESNIINPTILINCINDSKFDHLFHHAKKIHDERIKKDILREKIDLGVFNIYCKELTLSSELSAEGSVMRHCVAGYAEKVKRKEARIFHINYKENHSTLELSMTNNSLQIKQHKAKHNEIPNKKNKDIAILFVNYLNLYHKV